MVRRFQTHVHSIPLLSLWRGPAHRERHTINKRIVGPIQLHAVYVLQCSQRAATAAVGVASGCRNGLGPCRGIKHLPRVAAQCRRGFRIQIPVPSVILMELD
jgi:hypothetical protein